MGTTRHAVQWVMWTAVVAGVVGVAVPVFPQTRRYASASVTRTDEAPAAQPVTASVKAIPLAKVRQAAAKIDELIEAGYREHKVSPNPMVADEVFLRRLYLDVIGRIPTHAEAKAFLESRDPNKRSTLIDTLLESPGYVHHYFNYWADVLRIQSRQRRVPMQPYIDWVKDSLEANKPYDTMVWELLTAEGYTWENGAAGYYLRDIGMPLDNLSNTVQVFLGTRIVCAQCHDHPFDVWTQREYYEMAAFTYGVQTRKRNPELRDLERMFRKERSSLEGREQEMFQRAVQRVTQPLVHAVNETNQKLHLPKDYKYKDAEPNALVQPATMFGETVTVEPGFSRAEAFADWMTSTKNPRFTQVIANRLWKKAMGVGLIEPVDDVREDTAASNPALMAYLTSQMSALKYDMKQYLRIVFNTQTYQRGATAGEIDLSQAYYFPGPALRRMTAEQLWDSYLTLAIPDLDERQGVVRQPYNIDKLKEAQSMKAEEIYAMVKTDAEEMGKSDGNRRAMRRLREQVEAAQREGDMDKVKELRKQMQKQGRNMMGMEGEMGQRVREGVANDTKWRGYPREAVRAAEVESPAPPEHFLRQFGQSDREVIENANSDASVPQVLTLLNGPMLQQLMNDRAVLAKDFSAAKSPRQKIDALYMSILTRKPAAGEADYLLKQVRSDDAAGYIDIVWALLNTRQFMFIQ